MTSHSGYSPSHAKLALNTHGGHAQKRSSFSSFQGIKELQAIIERETAFTERDESTARTRTAFQRIRPRVGDDNYLHPLVQDAARRASSPTDTPERVEDPPANIVQWLSPFMLKDNTIQSHLIRTSGNPFWLIATANLAATRLQRWWRSLPIKRRKRRSRRRVLTDPSWRHPYRVWIESTDLALLPAATATTSVTSPSSSVALVVRKRTKLTPPESNDTEELIAYFNACASLIQRVWRESRFRRHARFQRRLLYHTAATSIQRRWRARMQERINRHNRYIAKICVIQRTWRAFTDRRLFRYFRMLIRQRELSDPGMVLKAMGENDMRSGLYLRFRLGGEVFPPLIYYKIYTTQHVTDIGSFAPRDYALDEKRRARRLHGLGVAAWHEEKGTDVNAWYKRWENNGWRLVSAMQLAHQAEENVIPAQHPKTWHHPNKLVRAADLARRRKEKQIEWKRKLYNLLPALNNNEHVINATLRVADECESKECLANTTTLPLLYSAPQKVGTIQSRKQRKIIEACFDDDELDDEEEVEVEDLLSWCSALDFNGYQGNWKQLGATDSQPHHHASIKLPALTK